MEVATSSNREVCSLQRAAIAPLLSLADDLEYDGQLGTTPPVVDQEQFGIELLEFLQWCRAKHQSEARLFHELNIKSSGKSPGKSSLCMTRPKNDRFSHRLLVKAILQRKKLSRYTGQKALRFFQKHIQLLGQNLRQEIGPPEVSHALSIFRRAVQKHPKYAEATQALDILRWCISFVLKAGLMKDSSKLLEIILMGMKRW
ncbi:hypothetical protein BBP40_004007 [Aspergillus hancockii]|nr:hypothetical protein BBP40_004007 [Aspergillus hancockii]